MSWNVNMRGHCELQEDESKVVEKLKEATKDMPGVSFAEFTSNNQTVNLLEDNNADASSEV